MANKTLKKVYKFCDHKFPKQKFSELKNIKNMAKNCTYEISNGFMHFS